MKIYTLFYEDTGLYNRNMFVMPNDAAAKKAMQLNLMEPKAENFRNEARLGNTVLISLGTFSEEEGLTKAEKIKICNLKELLNDNNRNLEDTQPDNA